jgi:RNA polymerase sigma-70 factor (ECF subfamily)
VAHEFPDTRWSQLLELHDPAHPRRAQILERLIRLYWRPAYHYVRTLRRVSAEDAEDLTQQFFTGLLARGHLARLEPERGSFRGFLKTSLRNFLVSADRAADARPRLFPFSEAESEWRADEAFDRAWGRGVLAGAVEALRVELTARGKTQQLELFEAYCLRDEDLSYAELGRRVGLGEDDVRNRLREARARLREILRKTLAEYLGPEDDLEEEMAFVLRK